MANPRPTAAQLGLIVVGALAGAGIGFGLLHGGALIAGGITGLGAALGGIPFNRAVMKQKRLDAARDAGAPPAP